MVDVKLWTSGQKLAKVIFGTPRSGEAPPVKSADFWRTVSTLLSKREYLVLGLRFGWISLQPMTLEDIAKLLPRADRRGIGVTTGEVKCIEIAALKKFRDPESMRRLRQQIRRPFIVCDSQGREREISADPMEPALRKCTF